MESAAAPAIGAIVAEQGGRDVLIAFARELEACGVRVRGLVQRSEPEMHLVDIHGGRAYAITQNLGSGSLSCRIDPTGFAEASAVLRDALAEGADLVVVNRFGKLEADGGGLAAEMLTVMAEGVPLLTCVGAEQMAPWRAFTGGAAQLLPADLAALRRWWMAAAPLGKRPPSDVGEPMR